MSKKLKVESLKLLEPEIVQRELQPFRGEFTQVVSTAVPALREARRVNDSGFDRIWKYYFEPKKNVLLSEHEEEVRKRLKHAWELLTGKVLNDRKAVLAHTKWCKENFMEISERTAYDDVRRAKMLFGDPRVSTAMFEKARMSAILLDQIENMKSISETGNTIDKIEAAKAINALARRYNAVNGLEEDIRTQIPRPAITINFNADPDVLKKQAAELMEGVAIDTDYTEAE
jgi:hypothetical protein